MKIVVVKFMHGSKEYEYNTDLNLTPYGVYDITADNNFTYSNPVIIVGYKDKPTYNKSLRTITSAKCLSTPKRPDDGIKKVIFNVFVVRSIYRYRRSIKSLYHYQSPSILIVLVFLKLLLSILESIISYSFLNTDALYSSSIL